MSDSHSTDDLFGRLAEDFRRRLRRGERPSITEYVRENPGLEESRIREGFAAIMALEMAQSFGEVASIGQPSPSRTIPGKLGDYRILRCVGQGGMGIVYE